MSSDQMLGPRDLGAVYLKRGLLVAAREQWEAWYRQCRETDDAVEQVRACNALGSLRMKERDYGGSRRFYLEARQLATSAAVPVLDTLKVTVNLSHLAYATGDLATARQLTLEAMDAAGGDVNTVTRGRVCLAKSAIDIADERWEEARAAASEARRCFAEAKQINLIGDALNNLGLIDLEEGGLDSAEQLLLQALLLHVRQRDQPGMAYASTELGRLYFRRNRLDEALKAVRRALDVLLSDASLLDRAEVARVSLVFGAIQLAEGQKASALKYLNRAAAYFAQLGFKREWDQSNRLIGQALALAGPARAARELTDDDRHLNYLTAVLDMTDDIESVDETLRGHSERVASLCLVIGRALRLPSDQLHALGHAARLHDVGKVAGAEHHAETGERMARAFALPEECLMAIRHHHERTDGSGGPSGLDGERIPLTARIIALADTYDHLTSGSDGAPLSHTKAMAELREGAGRQFDIRLVSSFEALHHVGEEVSV